MSLFALRRSSDICRFLNVKLCYNCSLSVIWSQNSKLILNFLLDLNFGRLLIRDRNSTRSASTRRRGSDRFESRPDISSYLETLKWFLLLLCQMRDINIWEYGECLGPKQAQFFTMHSWDFLTKVVQLKSWLSVGCYPITRVFELKRRDLSP